MLPPRAYLFISLNIIRALSIIGLILVFASNIVTVVHDIQAVNAFIKAGKSDDSSASSSNSTLTDMQDADYILGSTVPNQPAGAFWAVLNRLLIIGQVFVLFLSEIGWPSSFFNRFFPVLGEDFGLGALGIIQCLIGAAVLSHHVDDFTLVSAFFLFSIGCLNMLVGLIFRQKAKRYRSIFFWRDSKKSSLIPTHVHGIPTGPVMSAASSIISKPMQHHDDNRHSEYSTASAGASSPPPPKTFLGLGFGRQAHKAAEAHGISMPIAPSESLPRYAAKVNG